MQDITPVIVCIWVTEFQFGAGLNPRMIERWQLVLRMFFRSDLREDQKTTVLDVCPQRIRTPAQAGFG